MLSNEVKKIIKTALLYLFYIVLAYVFLALIFSCANPQPFIKNGLEKPPVGCEEFRERRGKC